MAVIEIKKAAGLVTQPNELDTVPGALTVAENVEITRDGVIEVARGFQDYSTNLPDYTPEQLFVFDGVAYLHLDDGIWYNTGSGWNRKGGAPLGGFSSLSGVWWDTSSNIAYIADPGRLCVWKFDLDAKTMDVLAGGTSGTANGTGTAAQFAEPCGIWGDGAGNLYVTDNTNFAIRKIVISTRVVTTFAGLIGTSGSTDASGGSARFGSPWGICGDGTNLYVSELSDGRIRKIVISSAAVTTLTSAFTEPNGLWIANGGSTLYVQRTDTIRMVNAVTGVTATLATGLDNLGIFYPGITSDGTYLYVGGENNFSINRVRIGDGSVSNEFFPASFLGDNPINGVHLSGDRILVVGSGVALAYPSSAYAAAIFYPSATSASSYKTLRTPGLIGGPP